MIRTSIALAVICACSQPHNITPLDGNSNIDSSSTSIDAPRDGDVGSDGGVLTTCPGASPELAVCGNGHWAWERPTATGQALSSTVAFSSSDVWAVGGTGTVAHFNGAGWSVEATPTCDNLTAIWGTSATNLWAIGENGRILHRNVSGWQVVDSGTCATLLGVWGAAGGDVWIAGDKGTLLRGGATGFAAVVFPTTDFLPSVWALSDSDVWVIDARTAIYHWNGATWTSVVTSNTWSLDTIWGTDAGHIFVGGYTWNAANTVWEFSETTAATPTPSILTGSKSGGLGGTSASDVWYVAGNNAYHFNGMQWQQAAIPIADNLLAVTMANPADGWAVGWEGERLHWNGTAWTDVTPAHDATSVWAASPNDAWLATTGGLEHWDGAMWNAPTAANVDVVWGTSSSDVYAVGFAAKHWNGNAWSTLTLPQPSARWFSVAGSGPNDVWLGGYGGALEHWNGATWTSVSATSSSNNIYAVWSFSPTDVWVGTGSGLLHYDGSSWAAIGPLTGEVLHIWGSGTHDVYVGGYGALYHYDGAAWTMAVARANHAFRNVWGQGPNDVWATSNSTISLSADVVHWDGNAWTTHVGVSGMELWGLGGSGTRIWMADIQGGLLHFVP